MVIQSINTYKKQNHPGTLSGMIAAMEKTQYEKEIMTY